MARISSCTQLALFLLIIGAQFLLTSCEPRPLRTKFIFEEKKTERLRINLSDTEMELLIEAVNSPLIQEPFKVLLILQVFCKKRDADVVFNPEAINLVLGNEKMELEVRKTLVDDYGLTEYGRQHASSNKLSPNMYPEVYRLKCMYKTSLSEEEKANPEIIDNSLQIMLNDFIRYNGLTVDIDTIHAVIAINHGGRILIFPYGAY